jgi:hypothetical protein
MLKSELSPIMHPTLHDHHRVPLYCDSGRYEVFVGDKFIRIFDEVSLPVEIRSLVAMVKASTIEEPENYLKDVPFWELGKIYTVDPDSQSAELGWRVCKDLYVLVLPTKFLLYLRGEGPCPEWIGDSG